MAIQDSTFPLQDALICDEPQWEGEEVDRNDDLVDDDELLRNGRETSLSPVALVTEEDLFWDDDELATLLSKEPTRVDGRLEFGVGFIRCEAVKWLMRVIAHYRFTSATAILAADYIDRFISSHHSQLNKPWMLQLAAVACLSLATKVEETQAPLALDLQVEGAKFVFEPKTIQRMELLVLSTLQWRMHPVTPLSFIDHIIRRLGLKPHLQLDFLNQSTHILMSLITNSRWGLYLPSVLASATMLHVMEQLDCCCWSASDYQNQLFSALISVNKEKVSECYKLIHELNICAHHKRKLSQVSESPNAVIEAYLLSSDSSNDSWGLNSNPETLAQATPPSSDSEPSVLKRPKYSSSSLNISS